MKGPNHHMSAALFLGLLALFASAPPAEAQFLKKLSKGLEKVNNALDKVEKVVTTPSATTKKERSPNQPVNAASVSSASDMSGESASIKTDFSESPDPHMPHFTDSTKFVLLDKTEVGSYFYHPTALTPVSEGFFAVRNQRGQWSFYNAETGECLFKNIGYQANNNPPRFNGGVALVKSGKGRKDGYKILYTDGRIRELDASHATIEDFVDGVAMAKSFDAKYIPSSFYIDINGKKIWPNLTTIGRKMGDLVPTIPMRKVGNGLRAIRKDGKWGFVDSRGVFKIPAQYVSVRDFSDGYAWVTTQIGNDYKIGLINAKGNWAIEPRFKGYNMEISQNYGDFHNGIARVVEDEAIVYYDPKGVELKRFPEAKGTGFTDGYAFVTMPGGTYRINEDFNLSKIGDRYEGFYDVDNFKPSFPFYPVSIVHYNRTAIRPDGLALVYFSPGENLELRPFSADGYAYAETKYRGGTVRGYIRPDGSYTVILGVNANDNHAWGGGPGGPWPEEPPIIGDIPPVPPAPPKEREHTTTPTAKYTVTTVASPAEGGSVNPGVPTSYGEAFKVSAIANPEWKLASITSSSPRSRTMDPKTFTVYEDVTLTANFIKKDKRSAPEAGVWEGIIPYTYNIPEGGRATEEVPLYLELQSTKSVKTPYGDKYGVLTLVFDPEKRYRSGRSVTNTHGGQQYNIMYIPMVVEGVVELDGKKYLQIEGGQLKLGNLFVEPGANDGGANALMANMLLTIFGDDLTLGEGSYLVEFNQSDGKINLGALKRFHTDYGWLPAGDERFMKLRTQGWLWGLDAGFPADFFAGSSALTPSAKRDNLTWYAPLSWYDGNDEAFKAARVTFDKYYKRFISDYLRLWQYE